MKKQTLFDQQYARRDSADVNPLVKVQKIDPSNEVSVRAANVSAVLYRARGVWPFDLMPDEIIVEEKRVIVTNNYFPFGSYTGSLSVDKISSIEVTHSIIFSSITLQCTELHGFHAQMKWLRHKDAQRIKEIVDGIKIKELSKVDLEQTAPKDISNTLQSLGHF